ncbi:MAG: acyltransferase family protein [Microthrixaceae bacterium]
MAAGEAGQPTNAEDQQQVAPMEPEVALSRLAFVDVMRTVAVGRVVINHALPWAWMKWFESLPVMFFASGLLVGRSLATRDWKTVFVGRFKRLAMPTGLYLAFAVTMKLTGAIPGTTEHLWYVWTFLLFTALSGVFLRLIRWSRIGTLAIVSVIVVVATLGPDSYMPWGVSGAYLLAWLAGMIWAEDNCRMPSKRALITTAVLGFAAAVVAVALLLQLDLLTSPSKLGISMAGLGAAWLAVGLLLRNQLEALMGLRAIGPFIRYLNKRLLTIYLWHLPATILGRQWANDLGLEPFWNACFVVLVTLVLTGVATVALGGLEDRASASSKRVKARADASRGADGPIDLR